LAPDLGTLPPTPSPVSAFGRSTLSPRGRGIRGQTPAHSSPPRGEGGPSGPDEGEAATDAEPAKKPKLIPAPITPYYSPPISRVEMGLQRSTVRRQSGGLFIVKGGWVRGWEIPVRAGPRKPPAGNPDAPGRFASRF